MEVVVLCWQVVFRLAATASTEHAECLDEGEEDQSGDACSDDDPLLLVLCEAGREA